MTARLLCKRLCLPIMLVIAFYLGGITALSYESYHESLIMSCGIFTAVFASIMGLGAKIYHFLFI